MTHQCVASLQGSITIDVLGAINRGLAPQDYRSIFLSHETQIKGALTYPMIHNLKVHATSTDDIQNKTRKTMSIYTSWLASPLPLPDFAGSSEVSMWGTTPPCEMMTSPRSFPNLELGQQGDALHDGGDSLFVISYCELQVARNDSRFLVISS